MAGQQRVQNYLDRHRISSLFEDLMARLVKNTPQEPIPYLIKILQKFDEKAKKPFQENPLVPKTIKPLTPSLSKTPRVRPKDPLAKSTSSLRKDQSLSRSTGHLSRSTSNLAKEPSGAKGGSPSSATSPVYAWQASSSTASQAWVDSEPMPYQPPPPKPYQPPDQVEEAFLKEELSADKLMKRYEKESPKKDSAASEKQKIEQRRAKPDQKAKKHKEELAALVEAQRKVETLGYLDSGETMDPDQGGFEEATDVLEDASDLMDEGVTNVKSTGQKVRRKPPPPQVKVGVCSRCANVLGGGDGGSTVAGFTQGYGAYASIDSSSEVSHSSSSDFESASQVSGPRPMAWEGTTVDDTRSGRPGTTRSMTHDQTSELFQSSSQYRSGGAEGSSSYRVQSTREVRSSQKWETSSYTSEVERRVTGTESLLERGRSWPQPGSDDDSSV